MKQRMAIKKFIKRSSISFLLAPFENVVGIIFLFSHFRAFREFSIMISFMQAYFSTLSRLFCFILRIELLNLIFSIRKATEKLLY